MCEWKAIKGYEGLYEVSSDGQVKSLKRKVKHGNTKMRVKEKILKPFIGDTGYPEVKLCKKDSQKTHRIHELVLRAFKKKHESKEKLICNHKDGVKTNNNIDNLEWVTYAKNNKHAYDNNLKSKAHIPKSDLIKMYIKERKTLKEIADKYGYCTVTVSKLMKKNGLKTRRNGR